MNPINPKNRSFFILLLIFFIQGMLQASHNRSAEIHYKRVAPFTKVVGSQTVPEFNYLISIIRYTDHGNSSVVADRCVDTVFFGDGSSAAVPRANGTATSCCGGSIGCGQIILTETGYTVKKNIYSIVHTYAGPGIFLIRSSDINRMPNIDNISNSVNVPFYIEAELVIANNTDENSAPVLTNNPTDRGIVGQCFIHHPGAYDPDGDSLSYEITVCKAFTGGAAAPGYFFPASGPGGSFGVDALTGLLTWCNPQNQGIFALAIKIREWRKTGCNGSYQQIGFVVRDFEVIVSSAVNDAFTIQSIPDTCLVAGMILNKNIYASGTGTPLINAGLTGYLSQPNTGTMIPSNSTHTLSSAIQWTSTCSHIRKMPHQVVAKYSVVVSGARRTSYRQFGVKVIPPAPNLYSVTKDTSKVFLKWTPVLNCNKITNYNIYRKIGPSSWTHSVCENGVPAGSGFQLIATVSSNDSSFTDGEFNQIPTGSTGNYIVTAVTADCSESFASTTQTTVLIVGVHKNVFFDEELWVYPNPFSSELTIDYKAAPGRSLELEFFSIDGKLIFRKTLVDSSKTTIETEDLPVGMSILKIKSEESTLYKKIVRQNQ